MCCCRACATKGVLLLGWLVLSLQGGLTFGGVLLLGRGLTFGGGVYNKVWEDYLQKQNLTQTVDILAHLGGPLS